MENQLNTVWGSVLGELEVVLSQANYQTWLKGTELASLDGSKAVVYVPNIFTRQWIQDKYHQQILDAINKVEPSVTQVEYTTKKSGNPEVKEDESSIKMPLKNIGKKYTQKIGRAHV